MFWNKEEKNKDGQIDNKKSKKRKKVSSYDNAKELMQMIFKKRDFKIEAREIKEEDKKAAIITVLIRVKANLPEARITVNSSLCAGVTIESHLTALKAMEMCQIKIK